MRFSEREGHRRVRQKIQTGGLDEPLRISLWNVLHLHLWSRRDFIDHHPFSSVGEIGKFTRDLSFEFFKRPIDARPYTGADQLKEIRKFFFECPWHEAYDFLEWTIGWVWPKKKLVDAINAVLERELAGYRCIDEMFVPITDEQEVALLDQVLADPKYPGPQKHLAAAVRFLSDRENPDYRNSIKESVSAVESMAQVVARKPKATLGSALAEIEKTVGLHPALRSGFSSIYGYSSDEGGIRHGMMDEPSLGADEAKLLLLMCTSFVNYLKTKV